MNKLIIGQILYTRDEKEVTVLSVGRKYFRTDFYRHDRYSLTDLCKDTQYSSCRERLYLTVEEIRLEREEYKTRSDLQLLFSWQNNKCLTLDELRKVKEIVAHHLK